jgi:hypothetical protein
MEQISSWLFLLMANLSYPGKVEKRHFVWKKQSEGRWSKGIIAKESWDGRRLILA